MAHPMHVASVPNDDCTGQVPTRAQYLRQSARSLKVYQRGMVQHPPGAQGHRHLRHPTEGNAVDQRIKVKCWKIGVVHTDIDILRMMVQR